MYFMIAALDRPEHRLASKDARRSPGISARQARANPDQLATEGKIMIRSLITVGASDREFVGAFSADDPYRKVDPFRSVSVLQWR